MTWRSCHRTDSKGLWPYYDNTRNEPENLSHNQYADIVAGSDFLDSLNRYDRCGRPVAVSSQKRQYLEKDGHVLHERVMTRNMTSWALIYFPMRAHYHGAEQAPPNSVVDDRIILIGDTLRGFWPHTVASTTQACYDAMTYADYTAVKTSNGGGRGRRWHGPLYKTEA